MLSKIKQLLSLFVWNIGFHKYEKELVNKYYDSSSENNSLCKQGIIVMIDGRQIHGGFADRIRGIAAVYLNGETPIEELSLWHDKIFMLRRGFGFLIVDNLKRASNGWSYAYHAPWFDDKISSTTGTKFKGYYDL